MIRPRSQQHLLIQGGTVVTQDSNRSVLTSDILITDGKISAVAPDITPPSPTRLLDARGMVVIPGLIQLGASLKFFRFTDALSGILGGKECLVWGITTLGGYELSSEQGPLQRGLEDSGIRTVPGKVDGGTDAMNRDNVDASAWFDGVTRGNASRLGLEKELGSIEPGKAGDLVVLDVQDIRALSHAEAPWPERILWSLKCSLIRWVVVDGEVTFRFAGYTSQGPIYQDF